MKIITGYSVVANSDRVEFISNCNAMIQQGYKPKGNLMIAGSPLRYIQKFVKQSKIEN